MYELITLFAIYIALFLFGITVMRHGLMLRFNRIMPEIFHTFVDRPWKGLIIGTLAATVLQSSTAVMVITVGLVAAKVLSFYYSIGIMLGANIGTVATLEILAYDLSSLGLPFLIAGVVFMFSNSEKLFSAGCLFFGFGMMIVAMTGFESLAVHLSSITIVHDWLNQAGQYNSVGVIAGVILSGIIQSSSAVTAMAMSFMNEGVLSLPSAVAIMLGANIGTCVTALLASIGASKEAKLAAFAHMWVNVGGVLLLLPFIDIFSSLVSATAVSPGRQLAHAAFIFNAASSFLFLPLAKPFSRFIEWMHGTK